VLYEMGDQLAQKDIRQRSAESLAVRYDVDIEQAKRVLNTTMDLFQQVRKGWDINHPELKSLLGWSALLHEVGLHINTRGIQRHSSYILQNIDLPGFGQEQQSILATLVRFHRKKIRKADIVEFTLLQQSQVLKLITLLRIGVLLNIKRQDDILPEIKITALDKKITLHLPDDWLSQKPVFSADLERELEYLKDIDFKLHY
ncbi:MAG: exopolyphosphatase, partial [Paraglaciecola sp.]|nr:exopolyphosphatase [Paraglaciecola sp.]